MIRSSDTFLSPDENYEAVLKILAVTVLIDHRTKDRELIEFAHAAMMHNQQLRPSVMLSRRMIIEWFHTEKTGIIDALKADEDDSYKSELLSRIKDSDLQRRLLSSVFSIAVCDYELHDEESDFIKQALKVWKTHMPTPAEIDAVA